MVEVRDQYGNPLAGVEVSFEVVQGDGTLGERFTVERTTSDARGRAEAALTLGPVQGTNVVQVSVEGIEVLSFIAEGAGEPVGPRPGSDFRAWHLPEAATIRLGKGLTEEIAFIRNGQVLALATQVGIWLYDVATSREVALLPTRRLWDMTVSRDGRVLASCGAYKDPIRLWDAATGDAILTIDHDAWAVAFSPDGRTLASASSFGIELWDVGTGSQAAALSGKGGIRYRIPGLLARRQAAGGRGILGRFPRPPVGHGKGCKDRDPGGTQGQGQFACLLARRKDPGLGVP